MQRPLADGTPDETAKRRAMMRVLATASSSEVVVALEALGTLPRLQVIRPPEVGLVMVRGKIGGDGSPFNVGEATVTRAAVRLATGETGFSYLLGREPEKAKAAAIIDAIWQSGTDRVRIEVEILAPLRVRQEQRRNEHAARIAATKVDFFTMVRGEDA